MNIPVQVELLSIELKLKKNNSENIFKVLFTYVWHISLIIFVAILFPSIYSLNCIDTTDFTAINPPLIL